MSSIRVSGNTSGYYDLTVPDVAGTNTIPLNQVVTTDVNGNLGVGTATPVTSLHVAKAGNNILTVERTNKVSGSGYFGINVENNSQTTLAYDNNSNFVIGTATDPSTQAGFSSAFEIDNTGLILGTPKPSTAQAISYGTQVNYDSSNLDPAINASSPGWYVLVPGLDDGSYTFHLRTGAHSSVIFQVGTGYAASAAESLQILQFTDNNNSDYLNIKGVRVTNGGGVEVYLDASNPTSFTMHVHAVGNGNFGNPIPFAATLSKQTGSPTVRDSAYPLYHQTARFNRIIAPNQPCANVYVRPGDPGAYDNGGSRVIIAGGVRHNVGGHYNTSDGRFTCPVDGIYEVSFSSNWYNSNAGTWIRPLIQKNGSTHTQHYENTASNPTWMHISAHTTISCSAGDYLTVYNQTQSGSGGGMDVNAYSNINFKLLV